MNVIQLKTPGGPEVCFTTRPTVYGGEASESKPKEERLRRET
jgi:hypothetical protein